MENLNPEPNRRLRVIQPHHRGKLALLCVKRAVQSRCGREATVEARRLVALARSWGWPKARIRVVRDVGHATSPPPGYWLNLIERREVGIVVVRDISRISRSLPDLERFLRKAAEARTVLGVAPAEGRDRRWSSRA